MNQIKYRAGYKYQLAGLYQFFLPRLVGIEYKNGFIALDPDRGCVTLQRGYAWDGCSGPTIDCKESMRASLIHDALYQLIRLGKLDRSRRKMADDLFRYTLIEDGFPRWRAWYYYHAVRKFGPKDGGKPREVHIAP